MVLGNEPSNVGRPEDPENRTASCKKTFGIPNLKSKNGRSEPAARDVASCLARFDGAFTVKAIPPIKSVMTAFPYWVDSDEPLARARQMMAGHSIRHLPVMDGSKLVSVLNAADVHGPAPDDCRIGDVCRTKAYVVGLSEPLDRVLAHMAEHHLDCVFVVKDGKLAGIFTVSDVCRRFAALLRSLFPSGGDDRAA